MNISESFKTSFNSRLYFIQWDAKVSLRFHGALPIPIHAVAEVPVPLISEREVKLRMWIGCGGMTLEIVEHGLMDILWID